MPQLHAATWAAVVASLWFVEARTANWFVSLVLLACLVAVSVVVGGPRRPAFVAAMVAGAGALVLHLVLGALAGNVPDDPTVLAFLPEWDLGNGVAIGGTYTAEQLVLSIERGAAVWVVCAGLGVLWQAVPGLRWCELAATIFGRGGQVLAPALCLGEALAVTRGTPRGQSRSAAVVRTADELARDARMHVSTARPSGLRTAMAGLLLVVTGALVLVIAAAGGVRIRVFADTVVEVEALTVASCLAAAWVVARLVCSRARLVGRLRWRDAVAFVGALTLGAGVVLVGRTGEAASLVTEPGAMPSVPLTLVSAVGAAAVGLVALHARGGQDAA